MRLESVDQRLRELADDLARYRLRLDASLAVRYKTFEKTVLGVILYDKRHDQQASFSRLKDLKAPKPEEKDLLVRSFQQAGLLDSRMSDRIDQHFEAAKEVVTRLARGESAIRIEDIAILPLIPRTRSMIEAARELERGREDLFAPLRRFESTVSAFFVNKRVSVEDSGALLVAVWPEGRRLPVENLSSGEKQLLILLTQALLREDEPVVYVADEPELSLHVSWQENLLLSLRQIASQSQIIVATHSPDIVGTFRDRVIDLAPRPV